MLKNYFTFLLLVIAAMELPAQFCTINSTVTHPAVLPSDTVEIDGAVIGSQVLQVVLRDDTVLFGFTLAYDSTRITSMSPLPTGLQASCHAALPCWILLDSSLQLRTCLTIGNTQVMGYSPGYPNYQVLWMRTENAVTTPFSGQSVPDTLRIYYRVHNADSVVPVGADVAQPLGVSLYPNPATQQVRLDYVLSEAAEVTVCVTDMVGHEVHAWSAVLQGVGQQHRGLDVSEWPAGAYLVRVQVGTARIVRKLIKLE